MKRSIPKSYAKYAANATTRTAVAPIVDRASLRIPSLPINNSFSTGYARFVPRKWRTNFKGAATGFKDVGCCNRFIGGMGFCCRWFALRPLDRKREPGHKTRHENGYLHYLPEDYSLARALARPFSSPK
ncbi:hypothetical protein [Rhizobium leguminosarum]|uniref:hypothetical protein n=1 Tax=Rhizobium leguminosarum TaxID=384 RepID=UPI0013EEF4AF|nr:hypothetical protein [Rhizobium leguminosarum]